MNRQLRRLWEEKVDYDEISITDSNEKESINDHCENSNYKYFVNFLAGYNYVFPKNKINTYKSFAASLNDYLSGKDKSFYVLHIGFYFFFTACAGVSVIVWIFNWICWVNQCCCCDFLHNPVNKRIAWWMSFTFLLGILACCISGCVSVNRFGFALDGAWCAFDRIYYDTINGEIKGPPYSSDNYEEEGFKHIDDNRWKGLKTDYSDQVKGLQSILENKIFINFFKVAKACGKILALIFFCLLLIIVTFAGVSLMFYACLKRQGNLIIFMHVFWNSIRFFIITFFIFGTVYGIYFHRFQDTIGLIYYIFHKENGDIQSDFGLDNNYLIKLCFTPSSEIDENDSDINYYPTEEKSKLCRAIKRDLNILYWALDDASKESQHLCAISLCSSFFGAVAIYFFLLVMHHYNNEIFFDSGKSIFKGFDGFGGGYKKKNTHQDPSYKKRKLRAEIEMTSNNDQNDNYKYVNKNENDNED